MNSIVSMKTWERLHNTNVADRFAIDAMDNILAAEGYYKDFNEEILKLMSKHELPTGSCGHICQLVENLLEIVEDLYGQVYVAADANNMSGDVFCAFSDTAHALMERNPNR